MGERGWSLTANDCRGFVNQIVVRQGGDHKEGEINAAGNITFQDGVPDMLAPDGKPLTVSLLKITATDDGPPGIAGEYPTTGIYLILDVGETQEPGDASDDIEQG